MSPDSSANSASKISEERNNRPSQNSPKRPRIVLQNQNEPHPHTIAAFPPNRDTLGGTAYFILDEGNVLVDCPAWDEANRAFLAEQGGVRWLFLTHRGAIGKVREIQQEFGCEIIIQEQEAYLLPDLAKTGFEQEYTITPKLQVLWTPGHSPGSSCLYYNQFEGVLFAGRHLLPNPQGKIVPLKTAKTFHWHRQLRSVQRLLDTFKPETLQWICPGANTGFLRGQYAVKNAYQTLAEIDLDRLKQEL